MPDYNSVAERIRIPALETASSFDEASTYIVLDNVEWELPKKLPFQNIGGGSGTTIHKESDKYQIASTTIDETFDTAFTNIPINIESIQVYKYVDGYKYNFLLKNLTVSTTKITATIEDVDPSYLFTDLSGIIFEYCLF